ncbi:MAG: RecX family transcriptional regulator, partial [bacterium]|nr:RecX family transcriptional regulator [bacterium]
MKIEKYKYLNGGKYKVYIDNNYYVIYEDIIIKHNILSKKEITEEELNIFLNENNYYESYYKVLNYIKFRIRSEKEVKTYLEKNNTDRKHIDNIIEKLKVEGYINDELFCVYYVADSINLKNIGPLKIKKELQKHDISDNFINKALEKFTKDIQYKKIKKYIA